LAAFQNAVLRSWLQHLHIPAAAAAAAASVAMPGMRTADNSSMLQTHERASRPAQCVMKSKDVSL
jgi:hypothetical protein